MGNDRGPRPTRNTLRTREGWESVGGRVRAGEEGLRHMSLAARATGRCRGGLSPEATRWAPVNRTAYHIAQTEQSPRDRPEPPAGDEEAPPTTIDDLP